MRQGQIVNGYEIISRPTNADAGKCLWAFARKGGQDYFIKEFLEPKVPRPDSMGTVADKQHRYAECQRFEQRQHKIARLLPADHPRAGNIVLTADFFSAGTRYYKVTKRIRGADVHPHGLAPDRQLILLRTLADSLCLLHESGIVHGDLKPENILLYQPAGSDLHTAKLIDLDDAYPDGDPPERDLVGGNPLYGAPEWLRYLRGDRAVDGSDLTPAVDVFAFGLLTHTYLYGCLPGYGEHESPAASLLAGRKLSWDSTVDGRWRDLLPAMTEPDSADRPAVVEVAKILAGENHDRERVPPSRVRINRDGRPGQAARSRLRINIGERS